MDEKGQPITPRQNRRSPVTIIGIVLIATGALVLLDRWLKTGWLAMAVLPLIGVLLLTGGIRSRNLRMIIPGAILSGLGLGLFIFLGIIFQTSWSNRLGLSLLAFGLAIMMFDWDRHNTTRRFHPAYAVLALLTYIAGIILLG